MKKIFEVTKYLWLGGVMGILQQFLGDLGTVKYQGNVLLDFTEIMSGFAIYAAIILLVIKRDVSPKYQFRDLLLFFIGLDLFYYLYEFFAITSSNAALDDPVYGKSILYMQIEHGISDFIYWTSIGLAAAIWALVATKLRHSGKKKLYIAMLIPLFAVIVLQLAVSAYSMIMFFVTGGVEIPIPGEEGASTIYEFNILFLLTALVSLVLCLYKFIKKPAVKALDA